MLDCKVVGLDDATHDIKRVRLAIDVGRAVRLLGRPIRLGHLRRLPAARLFHGQRAGRSRARIPCPAARAAPPAPMCANELKVGDTVRVEGPFGAVLSAREPSRPDHRRRRRLGHGADQVDRRARAADRRCPSTSISISASAASATSICTTISRRWQRARESAFHSRAERGRAARTSRTGWCTKPWPPTSTSSMAARPISPDRRSWSRRPTRLFEAARHATQRHPCRRLLHGRRDGQCRQENGSGTVTGLLEGRAAIVTGAGRGIGRAIAEALAGRGRQRDRRRQRRLDRRRRRRSDGGARSRQGARQECDRLQRERRLARRRASISSSWR